MVYRLARKLDLTIRNGIQTNLHELLINVGLVEADVNRVTCGHHVVVVDNLKTAFKYIDL